jgi:hypothetical protein
MRRLVSASGKPENPPNGMPVVKWEHGVKVVRDMRYRSTILS